MFAPTNTIHNQIKLKHLLKCVYIKNVSNVDNLLVVDCVLSYAPLVKFPNLPATHILRPHIKFSPNDQIQPKLFVFINGTNIYILSYNFTELNKLISMKV